MGIDRLHCGEDYISRKGCICRRNSSSERLFYKITKNCEENNRVRELLNREEKQNSLRTTNLPNTSAELLLEKLFYNV